MNDIDKIAVEAARDLRLVAERHSGLLSTITDDIEFSWRPIIKSAIEKATEHLYRLLDEQGARNWGLSRPTPATASEPHDKTTEYCVISGEDDTTTNSALQKAHDQIDQQAATILKMMTRIVQLESQDDTKRQIKTAQNLCEIYFNIAAEFISEEEIRKRRDAAIDAAMKEEKP